MTENRDGSMEENREDADGGFGQDISELIRRKKEETAAENAADGSAAANGTASSPEGSVSDGDIARLTERKDGRPRLRTRREGTRSHQLSAT